MKFEHVRKITFNNLETLNTVLVYLSHENNTVLVQGVEVSGVQSDLHLSQEGVAAEATVMPDCYQQGAGEELRAADRVLKVGDEGDESTF